MNGKRPYKQQLRARQQAATRQKIVRALVDLHESVGPARTTISEVAQRAGVGRMTVYKHFPSDRDMFQACGELWFSQHAPPDLEPAMRLGDEAKRVRAVLERLYPYYRSAAAMMGKVLRDAALMPELNAVVQDSWGRMIAGITDRLLPAGLSGARLRRAQAALDLILDIRTWTTLQSRGLNDAQAAALAADWFASAAQLPA